MRLCEECVGEGEGCRGAWAYCRCCGVIGAHEEDCGVEAKRARAEARQDRQTRRREQEGEPRRYTEEDVASRKRYAESVLRALVPEITAQGKLYGESDAGKRGVRVNRRLCQKLIHTVGATELGPCADGKTCKSFPCVMEMAGHPRMDEFHHSYYGD